MYSMPGYNCSIKERMLYSSCKGPLIYAMENEFGLVMDKKVTNELFIVLYLDKPDEALFFSLRLTMGKNSVKNFCVKNSILPKR